MVPHQKHLHYRFQSLLLIQHKTTASELEANAETTCSNLQPHCTGVKLLPRDQTSNSHQVLLTYYLN